LFLLAASAIAFAQADASLEALTLPVAETMMARKNRDIALARRFLEQSQADVITAGQKPNPQFNWMTQGINRAAGIGAGGLRDKTVDSIAGVSLTIERGDKARLRVATASQLETAAAADLVDTARTQLLALRGAYFDVLAAQEKVTHATEAARLFDRTLEAANMRLRAGDLSGADVARIGVDALRAYNDARAAEAELARARIALGTLIAAEAEATRIRVASAWPVVDTPPVLDVPDTAITGRADVRAALARVAAAEQARELARSLRTRDVTVGVQFEHYPVNDTNQMGSGNSLGVGFSIPLFLRHSFEGENARALADWYAARESLERIKAAALSDLLRARGDLEAARERVGRFETELLPKAAKGADAAELAFRNGAIGVMDLLDARRTLKALQIEASVARAEHAKALAAWRAATEAPVAVQSPSDAAAPGGIRR
jgi:cobalt-zinc-cadmium efflux system outer membrane protein